MLTDKSIEPSRSIPADNCRHGSGWGPGTTVSVLILNWNGKRFLEPCLQSVLSASCRHVEILLVDNGSTDDSVPYTTEYFPRVRVVALHDNAGFGRAYNSAVEQAAGRFLVFLNNDTVVDGAWLAPLVDELINNNKVGIATSKVLFIGSRVLNAAGGQLKLWQGGSELGFGRDEDFLSDVPIVEPFFASGSAMAISDDLFRRLGGFDSNLRFYAEDLDISWRARLAGFTIRYVPQSIVWHHYSGTSGVFNPTKHRLGTVNTLAVMIKCLSTGNLLHSLPAFSLFALAKGTALAVIQRNPAYLSNVALALRDLVRDFDKLKLRRRETQRLRVAPDRRILPSQGFGLGSAPWELLRILRQGQALNHRLSAVEAPSTLVSSH